MIRTILILIFSCTCFISQAQVNIITTIAGNGTAGYSGDGGLAINAKLKAPNNIRLFGSSMYICDALNHCIRKIDVGTGIISTLAGKGIAGFYGDGGLATNANLQVPSGISVDENGDVYISDALNVRIRKVQSITGVITTIGGKGISGSSGDGGLATDAEFNVPCGIHVDKIGNIYVADWGNDKVRRISNTSGVITTMAGTGVSGYSGDGGPAVNATLDGPLQVYTDTNSNLIIAEQYNHRVRKVDAVTGIITTIAGNGVAGFSGDGGLAINAKLNQPSGLHVDKQNNIYVAEYGNGTVRRIDAVTGIITTVAGTGVTGFSGDGGPATNAKLFCSDVFVDSYGNLIIADYENNRIRKVSSGVAVNDIDKAVEAKLFPNPTTGVFSVQVPAGISLLTIYNIGGVAVHTQTITSGSTEVDLSGFPTGIYLVYVRIGDQLYVNKVMKN